MEARDKKREQIIEVALKRFAHFGLSKTTMNEIAGDLNISKALLYYYFPDKINLYAAVLEHLLTETEKELNAKTESINDSLKCLNLSVELRQSFIEKYYTLLDPAHLSPIMNHPDLVNVFKTGELIQKKYIYNCLKKDSEKLSLNTQSLKSYSELLYESLLGIRLALLRSNKVTFGLDKELLTQITTKQKKLIRIFIRGLRKET